MSRSIDQHLTDEEFVNYVLGDLASGIEQEVDAHLERCPDCTHDLNEYYEAEQQFPVNEFESHREAFTALVRERLGLRVVPKGIAAFKEVFARLRGIQIGVLPASILIDAALDVPVIEASDDGKYSISVETDEKLAVHIRVTTLDAQLDNCEVTAAAGAWTATKMLHRGYGVLQAEFEIPMAERLKVIPTDVLHVSVHVGGPGNP